MNRVLVTGGSGLTGRALQATAPANREFVFWSSKDCDLRDSRAAIDSIRGLRPAGIINLASVRGGIGLSMRHPATDLRDNLRINLNVLEAAREIGAKVVLGLSSGMYPPSAELPLREESLHCGEPHASNYGYAFAKRMIEPMIRAYRSEHGLSVVGLSPNGIIGEHDMFHPERANMTAALIHRCHERRATDDPIVIWGDGSPRRELSYSRDIARDFLWALDEYNEPGILNIGTSEEITVGQVACFVAECMGIDPHRLEFDASRPSGVGRKSTDTSKYRSLSKATYTPIREALRRTVEWYVTHPGERRDGT